MLEIRQLTKQFGGIIALNNVTFSVREGTIHALIGPNGAGKSTMFKCITGFYTPTKGKVIYEGVEITGMTPHELAARGVVRTFQETTSFQEMTVYENVLVGRHLAAKSGLFAALLRLDREKQREAERKVLEVMDFMGLTKRKDQLTSELPLGSQRGLAIAIALTSGPKLLLLDEPFAGMNPEETQRMMEITRRICDTGVTVILVEHDMKAVMGLGERITVLNFGSLLAEGTPGEIRHNDEVIKAYLGEG